MKSKFQHYYRLTAKQKQELFANDNCFFVFDTNALLDIYRLGKDMSDKVLKLISKYKKRIVIPYHVAEEYHNSMLDVITDLHSCYTNYLKDNSEAALIEKMCNAASLNKYQPVKRIFLNIQEDAIKRMFVSINEEKNFINQQFQDWDLQNKISDHLGTQLLNGFDTNDIQQIETEGIGRYKNKIPPGYKDNDKDNNNNYGDLIIWKEILNFVKGKDGCSIIFVSRDHKEDWIESCHGMLCGPRIELIEEFKNASTGDFDICTLDGFIFHANTVNKVLEKDDLVKVKEMLKSPTAIIDDSKNSSLKENTDKKQEKEEISLKQSESINNTDKKLISSKYSPKQSECANDKDKEALPLL